MTLMTLTNTVLAATSNSNQHLVQQSTGRPEFNQNLPNNSTTRFALIRNKR